MFVRFDLKLELCLDIICSTFTLFCSVGNGTISVPFRGPPRYNPKRRSAAWGGWWTAGDRSSLASSTRIPAELDALLRRQGPTASPCSLERPFSSASSSISDGSHPSHEDDASILTGKLLGSGFGKFMMMVDYDEKNFMWVIKRNTKVTVIDKCVSNSWYFSFKTI